VKQRVQRRIAEYSAELLPDFAASIGVEAAAGAAVAMRASPQFGKWVSVHLGI
jgi:hypothetical protein